MRAFIIILLLLLAGSPAVRGANTNSPVNAEDSVPVPIPRATQKAIDFHRGNDLLLAVRLAGGLLGPALLLFTGWAARLRTYTLRVGRHWFIALCLLFLILAALEYVVTLPLDYYEEYVRMHAYGLSNQTFSKWLGDSMKGRVVEIVLGIPVLWATYLLLRKTPKRWWVYLGLAAVPFYIFVLVIEPVVIDPLFNKFTPLQNKPLESKILALADRAGIQGSRVYQVNKSVDTKMVNAYVTGFLGSKRIVIWDTAIAKLNEKELLFVMGHEMGHYVLDHVLKCLVCAIFLTFVALYFMDRMGGFFVHWFRHRLGFDQLSDIASLPLLVMLANLSAILLLPFGMAYSRHIEHEADRFGLEITHYNHAAGTGFTRLMDEDLALPRRGWLYEIWFGSHPSIADRIDFFNNYRPWERGQRMKYQDHFRATQSDKTATQSPVR